MLYRLNCQRLVFMAAVLIACLFIEKPLSLGAADLVVDASTDESGVEKRFRPLHGVNNGPLTMGETVDLSGYYREMQIPHIRLHDCEWPGASIVDMHAIFPDELADPNDPSQYHFAKTDEYLRASIATGASIVYRLGESIETTRTKHHVHPPKNAERWADTCLGIIRHYNEGWSDGSTYGIEYWEIWNEPENRPAMWSGTDAEYFMLYATTARLIKLNYPKLKVGGPSVGAVGEIVGGEFQPSSFTIDFLTHCRDQKLPLDFFSWHTYTNDPITYVIKASAIRKLLIQYGFQATEIHLNEWNYLPDNDWNPIIGTALQGENRRQFYNRQGGVEGATFIASVLLLLQDSPVDIGGFYAGDTNQFGLFDRYGTPKKTFYAFRAFAHLLETPVRLTASSGASQHILIGAGANQEKTRINILIVNTKDLHETLRIQLKNLPWSSPTRYEVMLLNNDKNLTMTQSGELSGNQIELENTLETQGVMIVRLQPQARL